MAGSSLSGPSAPGFRPAGPLVAVVLMALILVLSACGSDGEGADGSASASAADETASNEATTPTRATETAPAEDESSAPAEDAADDAADSGDDGAADEETADSAGDGADSGGAADALGTVVLLGQDTLLADVLSLGIRPVISGANLPDVGFTGMGDLDTSGIEVIDLFTLSLEEVATYGADTIVMLARTADLAGGEELVRDLAERVVIVPDGLQPAERLAFLGQELGAADAADGLLAELEAAQAEARAVVDGLDQPCRISMAAVYTGPSPAAFVEPIWDQPATAVEIGCTLVPDAADVTADANGRAFLSLEQLELLDAPTLVLLQSDTVEGEQASLDELASNPLWQQLPAVASGQVVQLDRLGYSGVAGRIRFVEDLLAALQN
ncbi:MAG: ABC transporter substrate-binding protein [Actinomycetota bacterium]